MKNAEQHCSDNIYQACFMVSSTLLTIFFHHVATTIVRSSGVNKIVGTTLLTIVARTSCSTMITTLFTHCSMNNIASTLHQPDQFFREYEHEGHEVTEVKCQRSFA